MGNRVDFFQPSEDRLAVPASNVLVFFDSVLCPHLEPIALVRGCWPEFSWATLAYDAAAGCMEGPPHIEQIETLFGMGKTVSIRQIYNGGARGASVFDIPIFEGQAEGISRTFGPDGETFELTARDFSCNLKRITVYGQRVVIADGSTVFLAGADTVFNPQAKANASGEPVAHMGNTYAMFCGESLNGNEWYLADAIYYLLCEYLWSEDLTLPNVEQLKALTDNQMVRDLDVTGMNLGDALHLCCEVADLEFRFVPRPCETGSRQAIVFYRSGKGRTVELNCQPAGQRLDVSKTNVAKLHGVRNFWPVTHKYIGQGDLKVYEATFDLVRAWDPADEDTDYDKFSLSGNVDFSQVKDVYRKWCLNEAGDYSNEPFSRGQAFNFSPVFESSNYVQRRRRFWPALSSDSQTKSLGYYLEVSYTNGANWRQYTYAFNNLLDECGIWLSSDRLDLDTWIAALKGVLKFRITASVISDDRLSCEVAKGPVNSTVPVVEHVMRLENKFKYRKVSSRSIFANASEAFGIADEVDDTQSLCEYVRKKNHGHTDMIEAINVQTLYPVLDYEVGDRITTSQDSRDLLSCRSDNRSICLIERVQIDFRKQCTNLKIVRRRSTLLPKS